MANDNKEIGEIVKKCKILLLDIEGTTTSISFVKDKLFPYAEENVKQFLDSQWETDDVKEVVAALRKLALEDQEKSVDGLVVIPGEDASKEDQIEGLVNNVKWQMSSDRKAGALKQLQGLIWKQGYDSGDIKGHVYDDVSPAMEQWRSVDGQRVFIYSSGSVQAQKLLFGQSQAGDLLRFIDGHFDTAVGAKQDAASYTAIADKIGVQPADVLFLTDILKEAEAARAAGFHVALVSREGNAPLSAEATDAFAVLHSLAQLTSNKRKTEPQDEQPAKVPKTDGDVDVKSSSESVVSNEKVTEKEAQNEEEKMEVEESSAVQDVGVNKDKVETVETTIEDVTDIIEPLDVPMADIEPVITEVEEKSTDTEMKTEEISSVVIESIKSGEADSMPEDSTKSEEVVTKADELVTKADEAVTKPSEKEAKPVEVVTKPAEVDAKSNNVVTKSDEGVKKVDDVLPAGEILQSTEEVPSSNDTKETLDAKTTEGVSKTIEEESVKSKDEIETQVREKAKEAEETPPVMVTEIEEITTENLGDVAEMIEDLEPIVEEPQNEDMEDLQNVGECLEKECDEILSKVQDVTNLDNIPLKPLLNPIVEESMETEIDAQNMDSNDVVDTILDSELELEMKQCNEVALNTVTELKDHAKVEESVETDVTDENKIGLEINAKLEDIIKDNNKENMKSSPPTKQDNIESNEKKEVRENETVKSSDKVDDSEEIKSNEKMEVKDNLDTKNEVQNSAQNEDKMDINDKIDNKDLIEKSDNLENTDKKETNNKVEEETPVLKPEENKALAAENNKDDDTTKTESTDAEMVTNEIKNDGEKDNESQVNGKATNGDAETVNVNGDVNNAEELSSRLSVENGKETVNGSNGDSVNSEKGQGDKVEAEVSDIKVKTVATEEPRTDPIEQPTEA